MRNEDIEIYHAIADAELAKDIAGTDSPFSIEVKFLEGLTQTQKDAFKTAADRWCKVIVGDLPDVMIDGQVIDDVQIIAQGRNIDGPGRILGQAGPTSLRPANAGGTAFLPARGRMSFDTADLAKMENDGSLVDVITHEMGHVLGVGTIWALKSLIDGVGGINPTFLGKIANAEYGMLKGTAATPIPLENTGGPGTRDSHWRDIIFGTELMTGFVAGAGNPISRMTVASLQDIGYTVNLDAADEYSLPDLALLAESGLLLANDWSASDEVMLPFIPFVLPDESLDL